MRIQYLKLTLLLIAYSCWGTAYAQHFPCNCETDFFTVNKFGQVQQWSLSNNTLTGGSTVLTGAHPRGLGFCGTDLDSRTFYTCVGGSVAKYYDTLSATWMNLPTPLSNPLNNGCFLEDQYYMADVLTLYYYDGTTFSQVPGVPAMTAYDVAVDTLGRAWVCTGPNSSQATELRVYDPTGLVTSYTFNFNTLGAYGVFFINGQLYIARGSPGEIFPITITGNTATAGAPISFPSINFYVDIADCQCFNVPSVCTDLVPTLKILPGNIAGVSVVETAVELTEINGEDTDGTIITVRIPVDPRFSFIWDVGLTMAAFTPVQNADWNYLGANPLFHVWTYNGPNLIIPGGTTTAFGFRGFYDPQSTDGQTTITVTVVPLSGGECNLVNNTDSERLIYFQ